MHFFGSKDKKFSFRNIESELSKSKHPITHKIKDKKIIMTLKIKDKQIIWTKLYFRQFYNRQKHSLNLIYLTASAT